MDFQFWGYETEDGFEVINPQEILRATFKAGVLDIWFSETHTMRFEGKSAIAIAERVAATSHTLNGKHVKTDFLKPFIQKQSQ